MRTDIRTLTCLLLAASLGAAGVAAARDLGPAEVVLAGPLEVDGAPVAGLHLALPAGEEERAPLTWVGLAPVGFAAEPRVAIQDAARGLFDGHEAVVELDLGADAARPLVIRGEVHGAAGDGGVRTTRFTVRAPAVRDAAELRAYLVDPGLAPVDTVFRCREDGAGDWLLTFPAGGAAATLAAPDGVERAYSSCSTRRNLSIVGGQHSGTLGHDLLFGGGDDLARVVLELEFEGSSPPLSLDGPPARVVDRLLDAGAGAAIAVGPTANPFTDPPAAATAAQPRQHACTLTRVQRAFPPPAPSP